MQTTETKYMNPYLAGFLLGIVLLFQYLHSRPRTGRKRRDQGWHRRHCWRGRAGARGSITRIMLLTASSRATVIH